MVVCRWFLLLLVALGLVSAATQAAHPPRQRSAALPPGQQGPVKPPSGDDMRIAAVVNDDVISVYDLDARMRMVMVSSNLPDTPETRQRIAGQVLRNLIDEKLQQQEAKRQNVTATEDEVKTSLQQIEKQNNMKPGQLDDFLKARGIDREALVSQLTASVVWAKLVRRQAAQSVEISDEEIDDMLKRLKEHANEPQSRVAEIFLAVDNPAQDDEVRKVAERLIEQMKQGARFSAVAQQFSQSATAAVGGDIGWIRPDQLPAELGKAVAQLHPGELSAPIRAAGGYYVMLVLDRRTGTTGAGQQEAVYDIVQVVFPLPPRATDSNKRAAIAEAQSVRAAAKDCPSMLAIGKEKAPQLSSEGHVKVSDISPEMRALIAKLGTGQPSQPILQKNGVGVIMVCGKAEGGDTTTVTRDAATESLTRQRLETLARRYLRDLRRGAYVDVRIGAKE